MESDRTVNEIFDNSRLFVFFLDSTDIESSGTLGDSITTSNIVNVLKQKQRQHIYVDEVISVHVFLQTPLVEQVRLDALRDRLDVSLDLFAVGSRRSGMHQDQEIPSSTIQDHLYSWKNRYDKPPTLLRNSEEHESPNSDMLRTLVWKVDVHINSANIRSQNASLHFSAYSKLRKVAVVAENQEDADEYLPSGIPVKQNAFDILASSQELGQQNRADETRELRANSRTPLRIFPALRARVRLSHVDGTTNPMKTFAVLDLAAASVLKHPIEIQQPTLSLSNGKVEAIAKPLTTRFPHLCQPLERLSLVFQLHPASTADTQQVLAVTISATITPSPSKCRHLKFEYKNTIDLPRKPISPLTSRALKPLPDQIDKKSQPKVPTKTEPLLQNLAITISCPPKVPTNTTLTYTLLLANNNPTQEISLCISPVLPRSGPTALLPMTPDVRVDKLPPGASVERSMQFQISGTGLVKPEALRVVEVDGVEGRESGSSALWSARSVVAGKSVDFGGDMLPDVLAFEAEGQSEGVASDDRADGELD